MTRRNQLRAIAGAMLLPRRAASQTKPPIRLVVLDVGGTIVEDRGDVPDSLRRAFAAGGIKVTPAEINEWRGASKREVVRHFVELRSKKGPALVESIYADFSAQIMQAYQSVPAIQGAEDAFRKMRAKGILLAATTGFDRPITSAIFRRLGWDQYFAATVTSDDVTEGRPAPFLIFHAMEAARVTNVREVVTVGDTPLDLQAGNNAGVRGVIGVLSGVGTEDKLRAEPHTAILKSVANLPDFLNNF